MDSPARWQRLEALLDEILARPQDEWVQMCVRLTPDDVELREELRSLLELTQGEDPILDRPAIVQVVPESDLLQPGTRVGAYRVAELIGYGGMGEVYRAERVDGIYEQSVALKIMQREAAAHAARFASERQILARLEHPGIARLLDGGVLPDGRPYMLMELVTGRPLMQWCNEKSLDLQQRLSLFRDICSAVAYAHRNRVAHLDLKPQNVLVSEQGAVKLVDFGIAKALQDDVAHTEHGDSPLTPGYAAPEQIERRSVSLASDVFALGMLLFELLCGKLPAAVTRGESPCALPVASRFASTLDRPAILPRLLRGDLDVVISKALKSDPDERYASAGSLLADLEALRQDVPISARPATLSYRAAKFARRHRRELGSAAAIGLCAAAAIAYLLHAAASRSTSGIAATAKSVAVLPFADLSEQKDQAYFSDGLTEELIERLARVPSLQVTARTSAFSFKDRDADLATIGRVLHAENVLEGSVRKSRDTLRVTARLVRASDGMQLWAHSYDQELSDVLKVQDAIASAVVAALQIKLSTGTGNSANAAPVNPEAFQQYMLGRYLLSVELPRKGAANAISALQKAVMLDPGFAPALSSLAFAKCMDGVQQGRRNFLDDAQPLLDRAQKLSPNEPSVYSARSMCRWYGLQFDGTLEDAQRAVALAPEDARFHNALAYALAGAGRIEEAILIARQSTALDPVNFFAWQSLGEFLKAAHRWAEARAAIERSIAINPDAVQARFQLATLDLFEGRIEEAANAFEGLPSPRLRQVGLALSEASKGHEAKYREALAELIDRYGEKTPYDIAAVCAWRKDLTATLYWLRKAVVQGDTALTELEFDPFFDSFRSEPEFKTIVRELGLPT